MFILRLFFVVTLLMLNSCAGSPDKPVESAKSVAPAKVAEMKEKDRKKEAATAIDPDVMFMLLVAEIAGQREQYGVALEGYMEAAKRVKDPRFAERAAVIAMYMKDSPKTQEAVSLWLKDDSKNLTARKIAALSALRADDKPAAIKQLSELLKEDAAGFETTLLELGGVMQKEGKIDSYYNTLTVLSSKQHDQPVIYFVQSLLALHIKNLPVAEKQIQKALKLKPDWDRAIMVQAQIAMASGDANKAKAMVKNAIAKYPGNNKLKKMYAQLLVKAENYNEAIEAYQQLVAADPKDMESQLTLGLLYLQVDQDQKAEEIFTSLLEQDDWRNQASFYLGKIEEKRGATDKALAWFDKVTEGEFAFDAGLDSVSILAKDKQFDAANKRLTTLLERFPKQNIRILTMQAEIYSQQKQYQKAFDVLNTALKDDAEQLELLYARALIAEHLKKQDVVEKDLKHILVKEPENVEALNALGYSLLDFPDRYTEAETYLQKAIKLRPDEAVIMDSYGWLLFKQGKHQEALDYLQRAYAKQQENEIAAHLAEVLWTLGKKDEAKKIFDNAIKNAPEDEYLLDFQQRILNKAK